MKPLFIGVLPNFEDDDYALSRKLLFAKAKNSWVAEFSKSLLDSFYNDEKAHATSLLGVSHYKDKRAESFLYTVDSARGAFALLLKSLDLPKNSEVIMPSFTCVVILNPVLWNGLKPVFADSSYGDFNNSLDELLAKVTEKTKIILVQHTFGKIIDVARLKYELKKKGRSDIIIVEDLAHALGEDYPQTKLKKSEPKVKKVGSIVFKKQERDKAKVEKAPGKVGTLADFAVMTFGVEKMITTIRGGALLVNKSAKTKSALNKLRKNYQNLPELPSKLQRKLLLNPLFWSVAIPLYNFGIGKFTAGRVLVWLGHKLNLLGIQIDIGEYKGDKPDYLPAKLPAKLAKIGSNQLQKLNRFNKHRRKIAYDYKEVLKNSKLAESSEQEEIERVFKSDLPHTFMRYPLLLANKEQRDKLIREAKSENIVLGDWYKTMFYSEEEFLEDLGYEPGSCENTEDIKDRIVNLPTAINSKQEHVNKIKQILRKL
jgi:dTDP-4-amino-4,6-dideoxygalactose transaminase